MNQTNHRLKSKTCRNLQQTIQEKENYLEGIRNQGHEEKKNPELQKIFWKDENLITIEKRYELVETWIICLQLETNRSNYGKVVSCHDSLLHTRTYNLT